MGDVPPSKQPRQQAARRERENSSPPLASGRSCASQTRANGPSRARTDADGAQGGCAGNPLCARVAHPASLSVEEVQMLQGKPQADGIADAANLLWRQSHVQVLPTELDDDKGI